MVTREGGVFKEEGKKKSLMAEDTEIQAASQQMSQSLTGLSPARSERHGEKRLHRSLLLFDCLNNHPITPYLDSCSFKVVKWPQVALSQKGAGSMRRCRSMTPWIRTL